MEDILKSIILGWLLGILSPGIVYAIQRFYQAKDIRKSLLAEFDEIRIRLVCISYLIADKYGLLDRDTIFWVYSHVLKYKGGYPLENVSKFLPELLKKDDQQIQALADKNKLDNLGTSLSLKTFETPFLNSEIGRISLFDIKTQGLIYEIRSQLQMLNENIEDVNFFYRLTFDTSVGAKNYQVACTNLDEHCKAIFNMSRRIVDKIDSLK